MDAEISLEEFIEAWKELEVKRARSGFLSHLVAYVVINVFLVFVNLWIDPSVIWFVWPLAGWGIGLAFHAYYSRPSKIVELVETKALEIEAYARKKRK